MQADPVLVGQDYAHEGDRQEAGLRHEGVGEREGGQGHHQGEGILEVIGDPVAAQQQHQHHGPRGPHAAPGQDRQQQLADVGVQPHCLFSLPGANPLENQEGEHGPQGIVDDAFPPHDRAYPAPGTDVAEDGHDHGGARHYQDRSHQQAETELQVQHIPGKQGAESPRHQRPRQDQVRHRNLRLADAVHLELQPALEQDHRHRERHQRVQALAEHGGRVQQARHRPHQDAGYQQEQDGRDMQEGGEPGCPDPQDQQAGNLQQRLFAHARSVPDFAGRFKSVG